MDQLRDKHNYDTDEYSGFDMVSISAMINNQQLDMLLEHNRAGGKAAYKTYVKYTFTNSLNVAALRPIIDDLFVDTQTLLPSDTLIIIFDGTVNDSVKAYLTDIWERNGIFVVVHELKRLQFNLFEHELNPQMEILSDSEQADLFTLYNIKDNPQKILPETNRFNALSLAFCLRPGQIIRCHRSSPTAAIIDYYRICV